MAKPILLVSDDYTDMRKGQLRTIASFGRDIHVATTLEEALYAIDFNHYKAVVIDRLLGKKPTTMTARPQEYPPRRDAKIDFSDYGLDFLGMLLKADTPNKDVSVAMSTLNRIKPTELAEIEEIYEVHIDIGDLVEINQPEMSFNLIPKIKRLTGDESGREDGMIQYLRRRIPKDYDPNSLFLELDLKVLVSEGSPTPSLDSEGHLEMVYAKPDVDVIEALTPFEALFLEDDLLDDVIVKHALMDLFDGREPGFSGAILCGPPGTGKSKIMEVLRDTYENTGAYVEVIDLSKIESPFVSETQNRLSRALSNCNEEAFKRQKASLLCIDEGTNFVVDPRDGARSTAKYYQGILDTWKRHIGNNRETVICIATNEMPESFDDALTRAGRLTVLYVAYPTPQKKSEMFGYFIPLFVTNGEDNIPLLIPNEEELDYFASLIPDGHGAAIEEISRTYVSHVENTLLKDKSGSTNLLGALRAGTQVNQKDVQRMINPDNFADYIQTCVGQRSQNH